MNLRDYTFLGTTRSLCPTCRRLVDAKIIVRHNRVYFRKQCPEHGTFDDFVCSDVAYYDRQVRKRPGKEKGTFKITRGKEKGEDKAGAARFGAGRTAGEWETLRRP